MYRKYKAGVEFFVIYIREAHPGENLKDVDGRKRRFDRTTTMDQRKEAANACLTSLKLTMPFLVDDMEGTVEKAYTGHPNRVYVLDRDGRVAMKGPRGPRGADITGAEKALRELLANPGGGNRRTPVGR